jgi:hypothetical protein
MRFLISVIDTTSRSPHSPEERQAIDDFNEKLVAAGQRILACGIDAPSLAAVFDYRTGSSEVTEGPFHDTEEFFAGFWVIEAKDLAEARELAAEGSRCCNRKVELRPLLG